MPEAGFEQYLTGQRRPDELTPPDRQARLDDLRKRYPLTHMEFAKAAILASVQVQTFGAGGEEWARGPSRYIQESPELPDLWIISKVTGFLPGVMADIRAAHLEEDLWTQFCFIPDVDLTACERVFGSDDPNKLDALREIVEENRSRNH